MGVGEEKAKIRAKLKAEILELEQDITRLNKVACDYGRDLTADEFAKLPPVIYKEWLIMRLNAKHELLDMFFPLEQPPEDDPLEELLY